MAEVKGANRWALEHHRPLTNEVMLALMDEVEAHIVGNKSKTIFSSQSEVYALASRFRGTVYKHPYIKKKHERILRAIIDRCGEAHYYKDPNRLYIPRKDIEDWMKVFQIPMERAEEYLRPLRLTGILELSDGPEHPYKISSKFFQVVGPVAQCLVVPVDIEKFVEMLAVASGLTSVFVITHSIRSKKYGEGGPLIPSFLRLSMTYTASGLDPEKMQIEDVLELRRVHEVDNYFVIEKHIPKELWRSVRTEAFEFMGSNSVIEGTTPGGYKLSRFWVKMHEEGARRYVQRLRERYERRYRGF